jgi:predicted PurR-regulated permease PerM
MAQSTSGPDRSFLQRVLLVALVIVLVLLFWAWRHVLLLAFASVLIAVGLNGMAMALASRTPLSRPWALLLSVLTVVGVIGGSFWLFGSQIAAQTAELIAAIPEAWETLRSNVSSTPWGNDVLSQIEEAVQSGGVQRAMGVAASVSGWTLSFANTALSTFLVVVGGIFLAADPAPYRAGALILFPRSMRAEMSETLDNAGRALSRWLLGTLVSMIFVAVLTAVALWLLGVPAFLALALVAGLSQFLPLVGPLLASIPAMLLALTVSPLTPLWVAAASFGISTIEANLLTPVVQKLAVSLQPAMMLFAIIAMGVLLGPLGTLLAVPVLVVATIVIVRFYVNGVLGENETAPAEAED